MFRKKMILDEINNLFKKNKSLLAFNIQDINHLYPLSDACIKLKKKAICQFSSRYLLYFDKFHDLKKIMNFFRKKNLYFFLDHCEDINIIKKCIKYNFDGVMFDGSKQKLQTNIINTNKIKRLIKNRSTILEAEIGPILGVEDGFKSVKKKLKKNDLIKFINKANFDLLAIGAGNTHGLSSNNKIDINLYQTAIEQKKKIKLVFHGGSGINKKVLRKIQKKNIVKINISSSLKKEVNNIYYKYLQKNKLFDVTEFNNFSKKKLNTFFYNFIKIYS